MHGLRLRLNLNGDLIEGCLTLQMVVRYGRVELLPHGKGTLLLDQSITLCLQLSLQFSLLQLLILLLQLSRWTHVLMGLSVVLPKWSLLIQPLPGVVLIQLLPMVVIEMLRWRLRLTKPCSTVL